LLPQDVQEKPGMISITDWGNIDQALPIAVKFDTGLEIQEFANPASLETADELLKKVKETADRLSFLGMHGPFSELVPASRDPLVRQVAKIRFEQAYQIAMKMGAQHLIIHSGFLPKTYPREIWIQNTFEFWVDFLTDKPKPGLFHIENVYEDEPNALLELVERVNEVFQDNLLTTCLDIGHVNANSSQSFEEWISTLGDRIRYVHLHNNYGVLDDHCELTKGTIDIVRVLDLLKVHSPKAIWTIETYVEDIEPSLLWLRDQGYF
jgi:sugar phosphate isomerase/epimerase